MFNDIKTIKIDLFYLLSPRASAYWIMSDGVSNQYGLTICTDCFTVQEVVILINILKIRYNLNCSIHYLRGNPRLYIKADSMENLLRTATQTISVTPYDSFFTL